MAGIDRAHGTVICPKNFSGVALNDFTLTFWAGESQIALALDKDVVNGALDQVFRTAVSSIATVSRIGTLTTATRTIRFAIEVLGDDTVTPGKLGMGPDNGAGSTPDSIADALTAAIVALGTTATISLSSATVGVFAY